ncbi:hypothetical protein OIDMADRAFT_18208 [Oidiodendron maius Zn]|uniref:Uncharacterized protein n=1 Tax=Oidiodendron maius (strain Zn) TaxID=913774 RepID=A0A0C3CYR7_OIDMZ|nr:hypothetical protein OIDMADRAFT_18208 [Oidiodendron maius Zn]
MMLHVLVTPNLPLPFFLMPSVGPLRSSRRVFPESTGPYVVQRDDPKGNTIDQGPDPLRQAKHFLSLRWRPASVAF